MVENEDSAAFAEKIEEILSYNAKNIQIIVDNALKLTKEKYSWNTITAEIINVYKGLTSTKNDLQ
ncbi:hypothetical protein J5893_01580 [bacterium]|nr:hypothetical protein [bacterium]